MGLLRDIAETYLAPSRVAARKKARMPGEEKLLAYLLFASLIAFLARVPVLVAEGKMTGSLSGFMGAQFVAAMIFGPLFIYALAACSRLLAGLMGGNGTYPAARLALFWPLLVLQPLVIANEFFKNLNLPSTAELALSLMIMAFFIYVWMAFLLVVERGQN